MEVRCSMESYDKVRQMAMYYSLDRIMYGSTLLYGIVRQSTSEGDVPFARQDYVSKYVATCITSSYASCSPQMANETNCRIDIILTSKNFTFATCPRSIFIVRTSLSTISANEFGPLGHLSILFYLI
jgi:hypothetical protein